MRVSSSRIRLALLLLLGLGPSFASTPARALEPDYSGLQDLLRQYTRVLPVAKGQPYDARFDYEQLYIDEDIWHTHRADRLATLHGVLLSADPGTMSERERTAWALNTYNLLVIERLTLGLLVPGRKFMRFDSPKQLHDDFGSFFGAPVAKVGGRDYSIAGFERWFVYGDTSADPTGDGSVPRQRPGDPRLQFALHRAALCGGLAIPWVYRADSLEAQLDRATRLALALPRFIRADEAAGQLLASNRFFDERADFGGSDMTGLVPFLSRHAPSTMRRFLSTRRITRVSQFFEPDWKLDQFDHPAPKLPGASGAPPPPKP